MKYMRLKDSIKDDKPHSHLSDCLYDELDRFTTLFITNQIDREGNYKGSEIFCGIMHHSTESIFIDPNLNDI